MKSELFFLMTFIWASFFGEENDIQENINHFLLGLKFKKPAIDRKKKGTPITHQNYKISLFSKDFLFSVQQIKHALLLRYIRNIINEQIERQLMNITIVQNQKAVGNHVHNPA